MATSFATWQDVAARWRALSTAEQGVATQLADDASGMVRDRWPDIDSRIANGSPAAASVMRVVAGMVKRAMINADTEGIESRSQASGPFSVSDKFANPLSNLYFTAADVLVFEPQGYRPAARVGWLA